MLNNNKNTHRYNACSLLLTRLSYILTRRSQRYSQFKREDFAIHVMVPNKQVTCRQMIGDLKQMKNYPIVHMWVNGFSQWWKSQ